MNRSFWIKSCLIMVVLSAFFFKSLYGEENRFSWDFSECELRDIIYALSMDTGISIVADDTVSGKGNFRFSGNDFDSAFNSFLNGARLFVSKNESLWTVSRFSLVEEDGLWSLDACDLEMGVILEKLSMELDCVITYDQMQIYPLSVHFRNLEIEELLEGLSLRLGGYEVQKKGKGYHFCKKNTGAVRNQENGFGYAKVELTDDGNVLVDLKDVRSEEVFEKLFRTAGFDFCLLADCERKIERCCFCGKDYEDALGKFCELNGFGIIRKDNIFYVIQDGTGKEKLIEGEKNWYKRSLKNVKAEKIVSIIIRRFGKIETILLPDEMSFMYCSGIDDHEEIEKLVEEVDVKNDGWVIELKYVKPEEFINCLPSDLDRKNIQTGVDKSCIYFNGTKETYDYLTELIGIWDRPVQRVSYDLLILQYDEGTEINWNAGINSQILKSGNRNTGVLSLGSVLNLNFNVISSFGVYFAANLQTSLENNKTRVYADTVLHGVAGKKINFQNTNTYRYRDNNLDPETGKPVYSGITKEIISGLKLDVVGYVRGDGAITSSVTASFSRQGNDSSASTGNPPPTSEKIITTEVCGRSGEPIILSGLIQDSFLERSKGNPALSWIPLFGNLFKNRERIKEKSQMVIYLIPHAESIEEQKIIVHNLKWGEEKCVEILNEMKMEDGLGGF